MSWGPGGGENLGTPPPPAGLHPFNPAPPLVPSRILSHRKYGPAVDIWSSGVIAYILLGGYPPFYSDDETELFRVIQSGVFEFHSPFWDHVSDSAQVGNYVVVPSSQHAHARDLHPP